MYDAWSKGGVHYIGSYGCYVKTTTTIVNGKSLEQSKPVITLLSCAPMLSIMDEGVEDEVEWKVACVFNVEIHAEYFRTVLLEKLLTLKSKQCVALQIVLRQTTRLLVYLGCLISVV